MPEKDIELAECERKHICTVKHCYRLKKQFLGSWYCPIHDKEALRIAEYRNGSLRTVRGFK